MSNEMKFDEKAIALELQILKEVFTFVNDRKSFYVGLRRALFINLVCHHL
jgi:hypothetical protein